MIWIPDFLCHYYEAADGPFRNLSDLPAPEAEAVLERIRQTGDRFASQRADDYLAVRRGLEERVQELFTAKGGRPKRIRPHYLIVGACPWLKSWYQNGCELRIPLAAFCAEHTASISFTYGDTFPAMRLRDGKPYRGQVYTLAELPGLVRRYGLPQAWNADGKHGPDRYIEAQVWDDEPLRLYVDEANILLGS
jgi:hypothetical protein